MSTSLRNGIPLQRPGGAVQVSRRTVLRGLGVLGAAGCGHPHRVGADPVANLPVMTPKWRTVALPAEATFLESACHHPSRPGRLYVPVTAHGAPDVTGLYEVDLETGAAERRCALPDGEWFGSALDASGTVWLCRVGAVGELVSVDLNESAPAARVRATLPASIQPNDVTVHEGTGDIYVAANRHRYSLSTARGQTLNTLMICARRGGTVYRYDPGGDGALTPIVENMRVLAGIAVDASADTLWLSQMHDLVSVSLADPRQRVRHQPFDDRLLADNLELHGRLLLFPFYREISASQANILQSRLKAGLVLTIARLAPASAFGDPDAVDVFPQVCYATWDVQRLRLQAWRLDLGGAYDGHCTHVAQVGTTLIFVNYLLSELLLVELPTG